MAPFFAPSTALRMRGRWGKGCPPALPPFLLCWAIPEEGGGVGVKSNHPSVDEVQGEQCWEHIQA